MKAVTYQGIKKVIVKEVKEPILEYQDDIIIRTTACSICGSDLHCYHGMIPSMEKDYITGHEVVGVVEEVGSEVTKVKKGDKVVVPFNIACGKCYYCRNKLESQCVVANRNYEIGATFGCSRLYGDYPGVQAEFVRIPFANFAPFRLPEHNELSDGELVLLTDALPTAYWAVEQAGVKAGDTVIILGCGPIGLLTQKMAWLRGAKRVIAVDHVQTRLQHAEKVNKVEIYNFKQNNELGNLLKEITQGGADSVIDCVGMGGKITPGELLQSVIRLQGGSMGAITMASQSVRIGGTVALVGVYGTRYNAFPLGDFFSRNVTITMGMAPVVHLIPGLFKMVMAGEVCVKDVISHEMPLDDAKKAYKMFDVQKDECLKIILKP
jgi:S-(hydroxymethyl)glutathione dehydrogenase / alcohol dehydrogenase